MELLLSLTISSHVWEADKLQRKCDWAEVIARAEVRLIFMKFLWGYIGRNKKFHTGKPLDISSIGSSRIQQ